MLEGSFFSLKASTLISPYSGFASRERVVAGVMGGECIGSCEGLSRGDSARESVASREAGCDDDSFDGTFVAHISTYSSREYLNLDAGSEVMR